MEPTGDRATIDLVTVHRLLLVPLAAALLALATACGGSDGGSAAGGEGAAARVPAIAVAYASLNADLESAQWKQLRQHLKRFPDSGRLIDKLLGALADENVSWDEDVAPALGPEAAIVALEAGGDGPEPILLTQPADAKKLDALLRRSKGRTFVRRAVDGWQVVAETAAQLDRYETELAKGALADDETYTQAVADLPDDALAKFYVEGDAFVAAAREAGQTGEIPALGRVRWISGAAEAVGDGLRLDATYKTSGGGPGMRAYTPSLLERVPAGVVAVASFDGGGATASIEGLKNQPALKRFVPQLEQTLGVSLDSLAALFGGEGVFYVRQAAPIPELTLITRVTDAAGAGRTLDRLAARLAQTVGARTGEATLGGAPAAFVEIAGVRVTYGVAGGVATITSSRTLSPPAQGDRLADDSAFRAAKEASGLGDETAGFVYVDLREAVSMIQGFAGVSGADVPPAVAGNLRPLKTFVSHVTRDGDEYRFVALLTVE